MAHGVAIGDRTLAASLADRVWPTSLAAERQLLVLPPLAPLLSGGGLQAGSTVAVDAAPGATGATSLALALAVGQSQNGSWVAGVGLGSLGLVAAAELGVVLGRLVLVADPNGELGGGRGAWASVIGALVDGFDVVLVGPASRRRLRASDARRLVGRARERGAVLVGVGGGLAGGRSTVCLTVTAGAWEGLGAGWGHLQGRRATIEATGRGPAARPRRANLWLPAATGGIEPVEPVTDPTPLPRVRRAARDERSIDRTRGRREVS
jgi:hypothetical protein